MEVGNICQHILGLMAQQAVAIVNNGWNTLADFEGYTADNIESWISSFSKVAVNRDRTLFPSMRACQLCAFNYWINTQILRDISLAPANFTAIALRGTLMDYQIYDKMRTSDPVVDKPDIFNYNKWASKKGSYSN